MTEQRWFPVRCCCAPKKVVGFLRLPDGQRPGRISLLDVGGREHAIELKTFSEMRSPAALPFSLESTTPIRALPAIELAVYSDDRPSEWWERFEHFIPAGDR